MLRLLKKRVQPQLSTLNTIEIDKHAILQNLAFLQSLKINKTIFPVLKSNAYGHGLKEMSIILKGTNVPYICVDSFPEYQIVKDYAKKKVLIMWETLPENYRHYNPRYATLVVYTVETLKYLVKQPNSFSIHLFLNTGMNREGLQIDQLQEVLEILLAYPHIKLEGVMSHFANADEVDSSFSESQIATFKWMYAMIKQAWFTPKRKHIWNSAWVVKNVDGFFNAWRSGVAMYGYNHLSPEDPYHALLGPLSPALRILTTVVSKQKLINGDIVSYGGRFTAAHSMQTVTVPFGYHEGLDRRLTNKRQVKRNNIVLPMVGTICMNLSCIDTQGNDIQIWDSIELISNDKHAVNSLQACATICGTIPYELLVKLDSKIRRVIV